MIILLLSLLIALTYSQSAGGPVIGIVTIPSDIPQFPPDHWSYFPASYIKYLESGGALVVPIQYDLPKENITHLLNQLNGVFFTGGGANLSDANGNPTPVGKTLSFIVDYVVNENYNGNYYPLWGTCLGFEAIAMSLSKNFSILSRCAECIDVNKNIYINSGYKSKLYHDMPEDLKQKLTSSNLSHFNEFYKFDIKAIEENKLKNLIIPTAYTYDGNGTIYISSYEALEIPIFATQFHPEKATFEWIDKNINHNYDSVRFQQYLSDFFVNEARKNRNSFPDYQNYIIENFNYTNVVGDPFSSVYVFASSTLNIKDKIDK